MYILKKNKRKKCPGCQGASTWQPEKGSPDIPAMLRLLMYYTPIFVCQATFTLGHPTV